MSWLSRPKDTNRPKLGLIYRIMRIFSRSLISVWFRELDVVDNENIPQEGGIMYVAWHPSGLIDPLLLHASLPGKLSILAKHTLFKIPLLGRLLKAGGGLPIYRASDSDNLEVSKNKNQNMLENVGKKISNGGKLLLFPEGKTHTDSEVKKAKTGAARIMLIALRSAKENNKTPPNIIPVGLHYSNSKKFRERGAVILERPMKLPNLPLIVENNNEQERIDRKWVSQVTEFIEAELKRASHSKTSWEERRLIWQGRSVVYAERAIKKGKKIRRLSFAESVLGARRMRAGWEYFAANDPKKIENILIKSKNHFEELDNMGITPFDVAAKPEKPGISGFLIALIAWIWAAAWMFGLVTWSAVFGNVPPYQANYLTMWGLKKKGIEESVHATMKLGTAVIIFPLWWIFASLAVTAIFLSNNSPIFILLNKHWLLAYFTQINPILMFIILLIWWPVSGKMHLNLYSRLVRSWLSLKRWSNWRKNELDWNRLQKQQREIGSLLITLGDSLILPGDKEWKDPPTAEDDYKHVSLR